MPIFRKSGVSVLFVHVPKAGGTSIENLFMRSGWDVGLLDRGVGKSFNVYRRCSPQHMHASMLSDLLRLQMFDLVFMVVREPLARFRSELVMRRPGLEEPWSDEVEEFAFQLLRNSSANPFTADNHIRPQSEFYVPGSKVFHLEEGLDRIAETLRDVHGLDLDLSEGVPHDTARRGSMSSSRIELPDHLERDLVQYYWDDFIRFGYDIPRSHARLKSRGRRS
ncbi:sulfotransferase family 2 domain-containing protein [Brachybacterium sp. DNPG3]